jgi:hypothetical protein
MARGLGSTSVLDEVDPANAVVNETALRRLLANGSPAEPRIGALALVRLVAVAAELTATLGGITGGAIALTNDVLVVLEDDAQGDLLGLK